jgi:uncharacterized membrane protein YeaQ/YmgE (transglycosylase-associated protein family)
MDIFSVSVQIVSGLLGGSLVVCGSKDLSNGVAGNSVLGILGGFLFGQLFNQLGVGHGPPDALTLTINGAIGAIGGAALTLLVGAVRALLAK